VTDPTRAGALRVDRSTGTARTLSTLLRRIQPFATTVVIATMAFIACLGYSGVFAGWGYLVPVALGVLGASAGVPSLSSPVDFASSLANGWADLLSSQAPVDMSNDVAVVPFATAWVATAFAQELDRRVNFFGIALAGVLVGLIGTSLFSVEVRSLAKLQGPLLIGLTLILALIQRRR